MYGAEQYICTRIYMYTCSLRGQFEGGGVVVVVLDDLRQTKVLHSIIEYIIV